MSVTLETDARAQGFAMEGAGGGLRWTSAARSHVGLRRNGNEDRWLATPSLLAVADGVGGGRAGEVAATVAISVLLAAASADPLDLSRIIEAFDDANRAIIALAERDQARHGMATTLTAAALYDDAVGVVHVGDSRAYRLRSGRLEALTQDHSFGGELVRSGLLGREQAACHPLRSVLTRSLGQAGRVQVDALQQPLRPGDLYLLCSDGLSGMVSEQDLATLLEEPDLDRAADQLVAAALRAGGRDNVTVVLGRVEGAPAEAAPVQRAAG